MHPQTPRFVIASAGGSALQRLPQCSCGVSSCTQTYRTAKLPVIIVLHGSGVDGNWMLQSLPFKQYADKNQVGSKALVCSDRCI